MSFEEIKQQATQDILRDSSLDEDDLKAIEIVVEGNFAYGWQSYYAKDSENYLRMIYALGNRKSLAGKGSLQWMIAKSFIVGWCAAANQRNEALEKNFVDESAELASNIMKEIDNIDLSFSVFCHQSLYQMANSSDDPAAYNAARERLLECLQKRQREIISEIDKLRLN